MPTDDTNKPIVSIIMNCRNGREFLREAIDSIYNQTYKNWEIVFWDNSSGDGSAEIAKSYDSRLHFFSSEQPTTLGKARNSALNQVNGQYLAFLDTDDKWLEDKLQMQVDLLERSKGSDFVYSNYFRINMPEEGRMIPGLKGKQPDGEVFGRFLRDYPVNLQTVMLRMEAVKKITPLFDETLELSEEFDFFMRFLLKSRALYICKPLAIYRIHANMSSRRLNRRYPFEAEYALNKLLQTDHSIKDVYKTQVNFFKAKIAYWKAKLEMENNNASRAAAVLFPYRFIDVKFFFLWFLTFLPAQLWKSLHSYKLNRRFY